MVKLLLAAYALVALSAADDPGPMHRIQLSGPRASVVSAAFSPNGETLYVLVRDQAINVWEILVYFWAGGTVRGYEANCVPLLCEVAARKSVAIRAGGE